MSCTTIIWSPSPRPAVTFLHDLLRDTPARSPPSDDAADSRAAAARLVNYYAHVAAAAGPAHRHLDHGQQQAAAQVSRPPAPRQWPAPSRPRPGWKPSALTWTRPLTTPPSGGCPATPSPSPRRWAGSCGPAVTGIRPHANTGRLSRRHARPGTGPARPARSTSFTLLQQLTGDYPAATADLAEAIEFFGDSATFPARPTPATTWAWFLANTAEYPAAAAHHRQALALARAAGDQLAEAVSLTDLGMVQLLTGDYPAATASLQQALPAFRRRRVPVRRGRRALGAGLGPTADRGLPGRRR